jgi:hypothetical protein
MAWSQAKHKWFEYTRSDLIAAGNGQYNAQHNPNTVVVEMLNDEIKEYSIKRNPGQRLRTEEHEWV